MSLLWENSYLVFFFLTVLTGGGAAFMAGRGLALGWRPFWIVAIYMLLLGFALRFFHFALFNGTLASPYYYITDTAVLILAAALGYRLTRTSQMVTQYGWLYRRTSPLTWTRK